MTKKRKKQPTPSGIEQHWLNRKHAARACRVAVQSFDAWHVKPVAKIGRQTFFLVRDIIANRVASALEKADATRPTDAQTEADREKYLLTREQRITQELRNAQTRRELAPVDLIDWTLSRVGSQISAILEAIPLKVKQLLPKMTASEIGLIEREIIKAQNAAATVTVNFDEFDQQQAKAKAAAEDSTITGGAECQGP